MSKPDWPQMGDPLNDRLPPQRRSGNVADAHDQVIQAQILPTMCNCVDAGLPYCGRPDCDVDWCWYCGDEYGEPCARHMDSGRP